MKHIVNKSKKLHLGCSNVYLEDYINIDANPDYYSSSCSKGFINNVSTTFGNYYKYSFGEAPNYILVDLEANISQPLPFETGSIEEVVMFHVLEHFPKYEVGKVLRNINRILKKDGEFIVAVPDTIGNANLLLKAKTEEEEDWILRLFEGTQKNKFSHHFCHYTERSLKLLLKEYGFGEFKDLENINFYPAIHIKAIKVENV